MRGDVGYLFCTFRRPVRHRLVHSVWKWRIMQQVGRQRGGRHYHRPSQVGNNEFQGTVFVALPQRDERAVSPSLQVLGNYKRIQL